MQPPLSLACEVAASPAPHSVQSVSLMLGQASAGHSQQCAEFLPLRNRGLGPLAVTVLAIALARRAPLLHWVEAGSVASGLLSRKCSALVHVGGFAAE
jgi:hypothetical protein